MVSMPGPMVLLLTYYQVGYVCMYSLPHLIHHIGIVISHHSWLRIHSCMQYVHVCVYNFFWRTVNRHEEICVSPTQETELGPQSVSPNGLTGYCILYLICHNLMFSISLCVMFLLFLKIYFLLNLCWFILFCYFHVYKQWILFTCYTYICCIASTFDILYFKSIPVQQVNILIH